jgi:carbohydrate-selective porin OprB
MSHSDSPATSSRRNAPAATRNLAIAACLILGIAAVTVRAVVVESGSSTRPRAANASRPAVDSNPVASNLVATSRATPSVSAEPIEVARRSASRPRVAASPGAPTVDAPLAGGHAPVAEMPEAATHAVPIAGPVPFLTPVSAPMSTSATLGTSASLPPDRFQRAPLDWRAIVAHPGVTVGAQEITDASSGSSDFAGARSIRTHSILELTLDMDSLLGWRGLTVYVEHKAKIGRNGSDNASFVQSFSNIDADDFRAMGEVWVEQRFLQDRVRIKTGRIDFNHTFAGTDNGASFLNASMGFSPSIVAAPTYPLPSIGVEAAVSPWSSLTIGVGVFNGRDGAPAPTAGTSRFRIAQANQQWTLGSSGLAGRLGVGAWRHSGMFSSITAETDDAFDVPGTRGWYTTLDQTLWQGHARDNDAENHASIAAFAQFGSSSPNVQAIHAHRGGGFTLSGLLAARPTDLIGVGVTHASWGTGRETIGELFYEFPVSSHLSLVADLQRVQRLDGPNLRTFGNVATMRTVLSF